MSTELPDWHAVHHKYLKQESLDALEEFVHRHEPSTAHDTDEDALEFRAELQAAIDCAIEQSHECPEDCTHRRGRHCGCGFGVCIRDSHTAADMYEPTIRGRYHR